MISRWGKKLDCFALARNDGFTLAEVLITLGIIGVVAAMTIPNLITAHQKKVTVTKLQKSISILNQAYRLSYDENGEASAREAHEMGAQAYFEKYWAPYLKTVHICNNYKECGYKSNTPWKRLNNTVDGTKPVSDERRVTLFTADGFLYQIYTTTTDNDGNLVTYPIVYVDINGPSGPNVFGKDFFIFQRVVQDNGGAILPNGRNSNSVYINNTDCAKGGEGRTCAERIRRAGWQIEKGYPW